MLSLLELTFFFQDALNPVGKETEYTLIISLELKQFILSKNAKKSPVLAP